MARRKRMTAVKFNQNLVMEVIGASLLVQKMPDLLNRFIFGNSPLTGTMATAAGVGAAWLVGSFMKRPNVANAGIALGVVEFVAPLIDEVTGIGKPVTSLPGVSPAGVMTNYAVKDVKYNDMADFVTLNEYVRSPGSALPYDRYKGQY